MKKFRIVTDVESDVLKNIDFICKKLGLTRSSYLRLLLLQDLSERKIS